MKKYQTLLPDGAAFRLSTKPDQELSLPSAQKGLRRKETETIVVSDAEKQQTWEEKGTLS